MTDSLLNKFKRVFRLNMLIGLIITISATYFIITGSYEGIESRQSTETILGWTAIAGLIYTVGFWFACMFREQFFKQTPNDS